MGNVLVISQYGGQSKGNFIPSLQELQKYIEKNTDSKVIYAFCEKCRQFDWTYKMQNEGNEVFFYGDNSVWNNFKYINSLVKKFDISVIYTHFEPFPYVLYLLKLFHPSLFIVNHMHSDFSANEDESLGFKDKITNILKNLMFKYIYVSDHFKTKNSVAIANALPESRLPVDYSKKTNNYIKKI